MLNRDDCSTHSSDAAPCLFLPLRLDVLFDSAGTAAIPIVEMITGFMDFPDELKAEKEGGFGWCWGFCSHANLLPQQEGRTWTVMETPIHPSLLEQVGSWDGYSHWCCR